MAKYQTSLHCSMRDLAAYLDTAVVNGSLSASLEESAEQTMGETRLILRVYERYSSLGGNRVSLTVALFGRDGDFLLTAIASGGSQAMFFKINTFGESAFLDRFVEALNRFPNRRR